jgi:hypothetical protein
LSIRETVSTGPVGTAGDSTSANIHFLGAGTVSGGAPVDAAVYYPAGGWQTVSIHRTMTNMAGTANVTRDISDGPGYNANDTVAVQVYPYRSINGVTIYSTTGAQSASTASNDTYAVTWNWNLLPEADGYRLLRDLNGAGYNEYLDVPINVNNYLDANAGWSPGNTVTPNTTQVGPSVRWNPSVGSQTNLPGQWGILEAIAFCIDDSAGDTGPYDLYIDNLTSGGTNWQTFESALAGANEISFRVPSLSGTTSGNLLTAPNVTQVSNLAADTGTKSLRIRWQWSGTNTTRWLRLTTSGAGNPQVNLDDPITFRMLLLPANSSPVAPPGPPLTINQLGVDKVLTWPGTHQLQSSLNATGTYSSVSGVTTAPWTNTFTDPEKFFRLVN